MSSRTLSHPYKTRAIAEAQVKTDKLDARMLATLLRGNLVAKDHISSKASRAAKEMLRQRMGSAFVPQSEHPFLIELYWELSGGFF